MIDAAFSWLGRMLVLQVILIIDTRIRADWSTVVKTELTEFTDAKLSPNITVANSAVPNTIFFKHNTAIVNKYY
jgi:hypothetical protein